MIYKRINYFFIESFDEQDNTAMAINCERTLEALLTYVIASAGTFH